MSSKEAPNDINNLLFPESINSFGIPDVYVIGIQESPSRDMTNWQIDLQSTIGATHVLYHNCTLGVLHLCIFMRRELIWFCTLPEDAVFNSRTKATNMHKTKGAIAVSFAIFGTSFLFINCHFRAHENKLKDRIEEYDKICGLINLPKNLKPLNPRYVSKDLTARFDFAFWFGDLNFRLENSSTEVMNIINEMNVENMEMESSIETLLKHDQLNKIMKKELAFFDFNEVSAVLFPPTYKFKYGSIDYDTDSKRVPSYTDRILFRSKKSYDFSCLHYNWIPSINTSDHKPVFSLIEVKLQPGKSYGRESILNAGSFDRQVYVEGLKRRSINQKDNNIKTGQTSLICNIS
jgi:inositol polyphosphate 5-phosphatase INPP5E